MRVSTSTVVIALMVVLAAAPASAQTVIDRALVRVTGGVETVVTQLDVREARLLKLVATPEAPEDAIANQLVDRRLMLADLARVPAQELPATALEARRSQWRESLGPGVDVTALLARAGMTDAALSTWLADDVRIEAYIALRLVAAAQPAPPDVQRYFDTHPEEFTRGGIVAPFDSVKDEISRKLASANRTRAVDGWLDSLRRRVDITVIK